MGCVMPLDAAGNWRELLRPQSGPRRPALFLDRDGVLVEEVGYLHRPEELRLLPGAAPCLAAARAAGVPVILVTNQSGVGRGYYGWEDFRATQQALAAAVAAAGGPADGGLDLVLACPHHPEAALPYRHDDPPCRKPNPGLLLEAARLLPVALARSWMVGDRANDLAAARRAGLAGGLLLVGAGTGGPREQPAAEALAGRGFAVRVGEDHRSLLTLIAELAAAVEEGGPQGLRSDAQSAENA